MGLLIEGSCVAPRPHFFVRQSPGMPNERSIAVVLCVVFYTAVYATLGLGSGNLSHGDVATDERAIVGAYAFRESGLLALRFTQVEDGRAALGRTPKWYSRHPSGGVVFLAILFDLGFTPAAARFLPLLATTLGLYGLFLAVRRSTGNALASLGTLALASTSSPIYLLADSLQLYSYAMFAKGWAYYFTIRIASSGGSERRRALGGAFAVAFFGVLLFGLETMPAIGLFAFLYPILGPTGGGSRRFGVAVFSALVSALGMFAAWILRLWNIGWTLGGGIGDAWRVVARAVVDRSLDDGESTPIECGYLEVVSERLAIYLPVQILALAILLVVLLGLVAWRPRRTFLLRPSAYGLASAALLADGAYFLVMRRHVAIHPHTTMHLAFGLAIAVAVLFASVADFVAGPSARVAAGIALALVAWGGALHPPGGAIPNLTTTAGRAESARVAAEFGTLMEAMPRDAVVLLPTTPFNWRVRSLAAEAGLIAIDAREERGGASLAELLASSAATERPVFVIVGRGSDPAFVARLEEYARSIGRGPRLKAFALANAEALRLPRVDYRLTAAELTASRLLEPALTAPFVDGRGVRLFRAGGDGVIVHAPSAPEERETVFELPLVGAAARADRFAIEVWYKPAGARQPPLRLAIEAEGPTGRAVVFDQVMQPTPEPGMFEIAASGAATTVRLMFRLSLAPAAPFGGGARLAVRSVTAVLDG